MRWWINKMIDISMSNPQRKGQQTDDSNTVPNATQKVEPGSGKVEVTDECGRKLMVTAEEADDMATPPDFTMSFWDYVLLVILIILIIIAAIYGQFWLCYALLAVILLVVPIGKEMLHSAICAFADAVRQTGKAVDDVLKIKEVLSTLVSMTGIGIIGYLVIKALSGSKSTKNEKNDNNHNVQQTSSTSEAKVFDDSLLLLEPTDESPSDGVVKSPDNRQLAYYLV